MTKKFVWILVAVMLFAYTPRTSALSSLILVTKETQAKIGVEFTLSALRVSDNAILINMEIPKKKTLKDLKRVTMDIGNYLPGVGASPWVSADLQTTQAKNGAVVVSFQLSPEMADKCSIRLGPIAPNVAMNSVYYDVQLKGYVTNPK